MMLRNILRYGHFAFIAFSPKSAKLLAPIDEVFWCSSAQLKALPLCPVNGKDSVIAFFDQENGLCMNSGIDAKQQTRQRNQVSVVKHNGIICLMKTYQRLGCLINEVCCLDKLKHITGVPKLIDISLKHRQVYQSLVPGTALSTLLNENGKTPVNLYLYENQMTEHPEYPCDFTAQSAATLLSDKFINKLSFMLNDIHDAGVLIRDVKFGNIMVEGDTPYLVDFDAATVLSTHSEKNRLSIAAENKHFNRLLPLNLPGI